MNDCPLTTNCNSLGHFLKLAEHESKLYNLNIDIVDEELINSLVCHWCLNHTTLYLVSNHSRLQTELRLTFSDIDPPISEIDREKAQKLIDQELSRVLKSTPHSALSNEYESKIPSWVQSAAERQNAKLPREDGIDLSRYNPPEELPANSDVADWRKALRSAYVSHSYLSGQQVNLSLLDEWGKNAWLIGNSQLQYILKEVEIELERLKKESDDTNRARKAAQEGSKAELLNLEETWKQGVGRMIEVQIAAEELRRTIKERQNHGPG